ncbi:MAG: cyclodeaminase/cyclohydrolase family protein [Planctomycetes bacterium]|nr:cyclodeaminase/cyclohydrolase family protein [Planctomycetota bacterium]
MTKHHPFRGFLDELKSSAPTPGGGAVAGLCGALAAALAHMVGSLSVGKKKFAAVEPELRESMGRLDTAIDMFLILADRDARAFDAFMKAWKLPRTNDSEKAARQTAVEGAASSACAPPLDMILLASLLLPEIRLAAERGNPHAVSDAGVAAILVTATVKAAALNVRINLPSLNATDRSARLAQLDDLVPPALDAARALEDEVLARL